MKNKARGAASVAMSMLAVLAVGASSAAAAPELQILVDSSVSVIVPQNDHSFPEEDLVDEESQAQSDLLEPLINEISALDGYQGAALGEEINEGTLYFSDYTTEAEEAIRKIEVSNDVSFDVIELPYSDDEIWDIAMEAVKALSNERIEVSSISTGSNNSSVELSSPDLSASSDLQDRARGIASRAVPEDVAIDFPEYEEHFSMDSRHNDGGQPTVGAASRHGAGNYCTNGLGWVNPGFRFYMLTAAHCVNFKNNQSVQYVGNPYNSGTYSGYIGTLVGNSNAPGSAALQLDATLVGVPATPSIAGEMFAGTNTTDSKVDINYWSEMPPLNTKLCVSGAATGTRCDLFVQDRTRKRVVTCGADGTCRFIDVMHIDRPEGKLIWGRGDSGGPIFRFQGGKRTIVGIVSSGTSLASCGSANYYPNTQCVYGLGAVTPISWIRSELLGETPNLVMRLRP